VRDGGRPSILMRRDGTVVETVRIYDCRVFAMCDPNVGKNAQSAYFVIGVGAMTPKRNLAVIDVLRNQDPTTEHLGHLMDIYRKWRATPIGVEDVAYQGSLIQFGLQKGLPCVPIKRDNRNKDERADFASVRYAALTVFHLQGTAWLKALEDELEQFPGKYKDQVDVIGDMVSVVALSPENVAAGMRPGQQNGTPGNRPRPLGGHVIG
jgi:phage terminase large subunit-like protein